MCAVDTVWVVGELSRRVAVCQGEQHLAHQLFMVSNTYLCSILLHELLEKEEVQSFSFIYQFTDYPCSLGHF